MASRTASHRRPERDAVWRLAALGVIFQPALDRQAGVVGGPAFAQTELLISTCPMVAWCTSDSMSAPATMAPPRI